MFKYNIVKKIGVIGEYKTGWKKELNLVSWNGASPKYDIRDWNPEHTKMGKGLTFTDDELKILEEMLKEL